MNRTQTLLRTSRNIDGRSKRATVSATPAHTVLIDNVPMTDTPKLRPKDLILGLLFASEGGQLDVAALIRAGSVFDIQSNSIRVTLARLQSEGLIDSPDRGVYQMGIRARALGDEASRWKMAEKRLRKWNGHYLLMVTGHLPRSDRQQIKAREKALTLGGFRQLREGLWIRPDNLEADIDRLKFRLHGLGLDPDAVLSTADRISLNAQDEIETLWNAAALNALYKAQTQELQTWLQTRETLPLEQAAKESWHLGAAAIRHIVYDPLLPNEWIEETNRHRFFKTVKTMNDAGQSVWAEFLRG